MTTPTPARYQNKPASLPCTNSSASFWHSEPNQFLLNHHTTPDLPSKADIIIVGSGITGASVARYLTSDARAAGLDILLLEAREICWGATGRNGGHCQPLLFDRSPEVAAFEVRNVDAVRTYIEAHDVDCEWRAVTGCRGFWDAAVFEAAKRDINALAEAEPRLAERVKVVEGKDEEAVRTHRVGKGASGVTLTEGAGQLWPYKYVSFIVEKCVREGRLNVQTNTPVTAVEAVEGEAEGGYRQLVRTPRGSVKARHVVLATNGYTSHLLRDFTDLIVPVRCEMSALHPPVGSQRLPNSYGMVGFEGGNPEHDDYLIQRPFYDSPNGDGSRRGGHLMFGGGRSVAMYDCVGESDDDIIDPGEADYLRRTLLRSMVLGGQTEGLKELKASHQWTGIKGYSRDNMPWVGKVPSQGGKDIFEKGLWLCGGYTGHGMPNATLCGKAVVEMVLDEEKEKLGYEKICEKLVKDKDLPQIYLITPQRLEAAHQLPSIAEQDVGGITQGGNPQETKPQDSKCAVI